MLKLSNIHNMLAVCLKKHSSFKHIAQSAQHDQKSLLKKSQPCRFLNDLNRPQTYLCYCVNPSTYYTQLFVSKARKFNVLRSLTYQSNPQKTVLINETVEVLIQKQQCGSGEGQVITMHFTFCHVSNLKNNRDVTVVTFKLTDTNAV